MLSSDYEKLVEAFLLDDRSTLVAPRFLVRINGKDRYIDVLAMKPRERWFFLVEVTEDRSPLKLAPKITEFGAYADSIASRLEIDFGLDGEWKAIPWIIIRKDADRAFTKALDGIPYKRTFIEELVLRRIDPSQMLDKEIWGPLN